MTQKELFASLSDSEIESWIETHHEIVSRMDVYPYFSGVSIDGKWEIAARWTNMFEEKYRGHIWDGDYDDALEEFINDNIKS